MSNPRLRLNDAFTNPIRLSIIATLANVDDIDFKSLKEIVDISDSALSKHASALEEAGYVKIRKGFVGKRPRTWFATTKDGNKAFDEHVQALRDLTAGLGVPKLPSAQ